jgi:O-antigen ligase
MERYKKLSPETQKVMPKGSSNGSFQTPKVTLWFFQMRAEAVVSIAQDKLAKPAIVGRGPSGLVYLTTGARGAFSARDLPLMVRWSFLLFIGTIAFDMWSSAKLCGLLFFAIYFVYHNPLSRKRSFPPIPGVMIWFMIYVAVYALNGLFLPTERLDEFFTHLFTLVQVIVFCWIASDILQEEKIAKKALLTYSIASVMLAFGLLLSLPGFSIVGEGGTERMSAIGANANSLAAVMALAVVVLLGLWLNLPDKSLTRSMWMFGSMFALSLATVYTGSRGGVVVLMVGLSVYLIPYWKKRWRMSAVIVALIAMAGLAYVAATTPVFSERWLDYYDGQESTRDRVYEEALVMISQRPLVGWQPVEFWYELGSRTYARSIRDAHNTYLHLLLEVGIVGAVPFLIGLWLCGQAAWKARNRNLGLLPLAIFLATLAEGMSLTSIHLKPTWFFLAVTVAVRGERKRPSIILVGRPIDNSLQTSSLKLNSSTQSNGV